MAPPTFFGTRKEATYPPDPQSLPWPPQPPHSFFFKRQTMPLSQLETVFGVRPGVECFLLKHVLQVRMGRQTDAQGSAGVSQGQWAAGCPVPLSSGSSARRALTVSGLGLAMVHADSFGCLPQKCPQDPALGGFQARQSQGGSKWRATARELPGGRDQSFPVRASPGC